MHKFFAETMPVEVVQRRNTLICGSSYEFVSADQSKPFDPFSSPRFFSATSSVSSCASAATTSFRSDETELYASHKIVRKTIPSTHNRASTNFSGSRCRVVHALLRVLVAMPASEIARQKKSCQRSETARAMAQPITPPPMIRILAWS